MAKSIMLIKWGWQAISAEMKRKLSFKDADNGFD
jgi:hypothetical protein